MIGSKSVPPASAFMSSQCSTALRVRIARPHSTNCQGIAWRLQQCQGAQVWLQMKLIGAHHCQQRVILPHQARYLAEQLSLGIHGWHTEPLSSFDCPLDRTCILAMRSLQAPSYMQGLCQKLLCRKFHPLMLIYVLHVQLFEQAVQNQSCGIKPMLSEIGLSRFYT